MKPVPSEVLQCVREIRPGGGVCGVAHALETSMRKQGVRTDSFTLSDLGLRRDANKNPNLYAQKISLLFDILHYTFTGSLVARRRFDSRRTIAHNDILFGDVYVNHGLHRAMLDASGQKWRMLLRNPLHPFLVAREWLRFRVGVHEHYVCFSKSEAEQMERYYPSTRGKTRVIPNGVDIERFRPDAALRTQGRAEYGLSDDDFALVFVGHEYERKGLYPLVDALALLPPRVRLLVAGGSAQEIERGKAAAQRAGVLGRVSFLGVVKAVERVLNASDALVLPSRFEAWPLVALEAMACGIPAVMTPTGGVPECLTDGVNGRLVRADARDIAQKVNSLLEDPAAYGAMKLAARETALRYSWDEIAARYLALLGVEPGEKPAGGGP